jgi:hypothetical protein
VRASSTFTRRRIVASPTVPQWQGFRDRLHCAAVQRPPAARTRWPDLATRYPARPAIDVEGALTHFARLVIGFDTGPVGDELANAVAQTSRNATQFTTARPESVRGTCALIAAALGDDSLVAFCSGGRTLGTRVVKSRVFEVDDLDVGGLARHLATAARARLPPSRVRAAMEVLRDAFAADRLPDPRIALVATYVYFARVAALGGPDLVAAARTWLDGGTIDLPESTPVAGIADGEDPRVKIFELFAPQLTDEDELALQAEVFEHVAELHPVRQTLESRLENNAAIYLFLARQPLPIDWQARVDPYVARWLGAEVSDESLGEHQDALWKVHAGFVKPVQIRAHVLRHLNVDPALRALHLGDSQTVAAYTGGGTISTFRPGKYFHDDWRKLVRYLAAAREAPGATRATVEPAWFDFLARPRSPRLSWTSLLVIQSVITVAIGRGAPSEVGIDLRHVLTGAR